MEKKQPDFRALVSRAREDNYRIGHLAEAVDLLMVNEFRLDNNNKQLCHCVWAIGEAIGLFVERQLAILEDLDRVPPGSS